MNLHKLFLTKNSCYQDGKKIKPKGIMVHSTGANNPWLKRYVGPDDGLLGKNQYGNHWNTAYPGGVAVCVHGFIGKLKDGTIATYQTLPWDHRGWHAGKHTGNDQYIGFEICEDDLTDGAYFNKVYKEAAELCAYLCKQFGLTEKNIICHSEGYTKGVASAHGDVMHWWPKHGKNMDTFRAEVAKLLKGNNTPVTESSNTASTGQLYRIRKTWKDSKSQIGAFENLDSAKDMADKNPGFKVYDKSGKLVYDSTKVTKEFESYTVRITTAVLNVRSGPGTGYKVNMTVKEGGVYTIVEEQNGWGKLKSGAGWISLAYAKRV